MIVKNEAHCIQRCLATVKPYIDRYAISDTGSTDNTIELIKAALDPLPGEVTQDPWQDFSTNRNLALERCQGDWVFAIDADEVFHAPPGPLPLDLQFDAYLGLSKVMTHYWRSRIVKNGTYHYTGKVHEVLVPKISNTTVARLPETHWYGDFCDGNRTKAGTKYLSDAAILHAELNANPNDARSTFYLGQTYRCLGWTQMAKTYYLKRTQMGGWPEEVYYSMYQHALLRQQEEKSVWPVINDFMAAAMYRPCRLEALASMCRSLRQEKAWPLIYTLAAHRSMPNSDILFVEPNAVWQIIEEHALAAFYLGRKAEALDLFRKVLGYNLSAEDSKRMEQNIAYCL